MLKIPKYTSYFHPSSFSHVTQTGENCKKKYSCKFRMYQLLFAYEETSDRINTVRCASLTHSNSKSSRPDPRLGLKMSPLNSRVLLFVFSSNCRRPTSRLDTVHERDQRPTPNQTTTSRHRLSQ